MRYQCARADGAVMGCLRDVAEPGSITACQPFSSTSSTTRHFPGILDKAPPRCAVRIADSHLRSPVTPPLFEGRQDLISLR